MSTLVLKENIVSLEDKGRRANALYQTRLKPILEPAENGKAVAIHLDSGDYVVAQTTGDAMRKMLLQHPQGGMVVRFIGPASPEEKRRALHLKVAESERL